MSALMISPDNTEIIKGYSHTIQNKYKHLDNKKRVQHSHDFNGQQNEVLTLK